VLRYINISFIWVLACSLCTVTTALLFNPDTVNAYYHIARYSILVSFIIGSLASILVSIEAFKKKEWQSSIKAVAMVLIFIACFWVTFMIFVVSHQGV
jgi:ABC-type Na+ efflux pump permease subunit